MQFLGPRKRSLCGSVMDWRLVQGVTLASPYNSREQGPSNRGTEEEVGLENGQMWMNELPSQASRKFAWLERPNERKATPAEEGEGCKK